MADWEIWATIAALTVATAATRSSFWLVGHHITIPRRVQEMLRYAPGCALVAIIAPDMLVVADHPMVVSLANPKLLAGVAATAYYLWRKNMLETIIFGMAVFTGLRIWLQ
ncbi:MAG: AzlD domain-containing protein [Pseudomonadota bacterium]